MIQKKKALSIIAGILMAGSIVFVSQPAFAATKNPGGNFFSGLVEYIVQTFHLDKTQVQSAVQNYQQQKKATITPRPTMSPEQRTAAEKKRLDVLVSQGKINAGQETAILSELETLRGKYPVDQNVTPDQRRTQRQNMQNELKTWAESQKIDPRYVMAFDIPGRGMGRGKNGNGFGFRGLRGRLSPTPTP
jgi:hypothetical protein